MFFDSVLPTIAKATQLERLLEKAEQTAPGGQKAKEIRLFEKLEQLKEKQMVAENPDASYISKAIHAAVQ